MGNKLFRKRVKFKDRNKPGKNLVKKKDLRRGDFDEVFREREKLKKLGGFLTD